MEIEILRGYTRAFKAVNGVNVAPFEEIILRIVPAPPPENIPLGRFKRDGEKLGEVLAGIIPSGTADKAVSKLFATSVMGEGELLESAFTKARLDGAPIEEAVRAALGPAAPEAMVRWVAKLASRAYMEDPPYGRWVLYDAPGHAVGWITDRRDIDDNPLAEYMIDEGHYESMHRLRPHSWRHFDDGRIRYVMDADSRRPAYRWIFVEEG